MENIQAFIEYRFKPLDRETCAAQIALLLLTSTIPCLWGGDGLFPALISVGTAIAVGTVMALYCIRRLDRKSSKFLSSGIAFTYIAIILLLAGAAGRRPSAGTGHAMLGVVLVWPVFETIFLLIQHVLVRRGAYLHSENRAYGKLAAIGGILGAAGARGMGWLLPHTSIPALVALGFSFVLGAVGLQYFLKIYYLKKYALPD